jgi:hypothetical protein
VVLSKRERYIAVATVAALGLVAVYYGFVSPLLDRKSDLDSKVREAKLQLDRANRVIDDSHRLGPVLAQRLAGPVKKSASEAESQMLKSIGEWAHDARMTAPSIDKPDRGEREKDFAKMTFRASATGTMSQIGNFLWRMNTSAVPVRVGEMTLTTHKEGTDDLTLQLSISTIYLAADTENAPAGAPGPVKETTR